MELRHLRTFSAVARRLSFSAAARALHISQSAVSEAVKDLEQELGVELLVRTRHSVKLTAAGSAFLREADRIVADAGNAVRLAQQAARGETGRLAIGFPAPPTAPFLPTLVREFRRKHSGVDLSLHELTPREMMQGMADRRIDLGFSRPLSDDARLLPMHEEKLFDDELCVALPRGHVLAKDDARLPLKEIRREELVLMGRSEAPWLYDTIIAACRKAGFSPRVVATPDYMTTVLMLVEAEVGISIMPMSTAPYRRHLPVVFRRLKASGAQIPLLMIWPRGETPTVRLFCELVRSRRAEILKAVTL